MGPVCLRLFVAACIVVTAFGAGERHRSDAVAAAPTNLVVSVVQSGLDHPWDVAFSPDGTMFITERWGRLTVHRPNGEWRELATDRSDLWVSGETGLMAVEIDPAFATNRRIYTCQGTADAANTVQVIAWQIDPAYTTATRQNDPLVGGIDGTSGRHGGCQLRIDSAGWLWIGTGDAAWGTNPQNVSSLAGKTLRVNRMNGQPAAGNPHGLVYTLGHRNLQGLVERPGTGQMWSVEHGSFRDDEINRLVAGGNYGWNPVPTPYNETVPMTAPGAIPAQWSSGPTTIAPSGATFLQGASWGGWQGALAVSVLKNEELRIMFFDAAGRFTGDVAPPQLDGPFGRLRAAELGPDGALYLTTDNGGFADHVVSVRPSAPPPLPGCSVAATSSLADRVDIAVRGGDDQAWTRSVTGSTWGAWSGLGGVLTSETSASSWGEGRLDLVARGGDLGIWHNTRSGDGAAWTGWRPVGGVATSAPAAVASTSGRIDLFTRGADNSLWTNVWTTASGWTGWTSLGGQLTSAPSAASWGPGRLDVFAIGSDSAVWHRAFSGGTWLPWQPLSGVATSSPGAVSWGPDRIDIFVRGADGALWSRSWTVGGWTGWGTVGGVLASAPAVAAVAPNRLDVFVCGTDGDLWLQSWAGQTWTGWRPSG